MDFLYRILIFFSKIFPTRKIPVLLYHSIADDGGRISVSPGKFEQQLKTLKNDGYVSIMPNEILQCLDGNKKFPRRRILITFDDGFQDNYDLARPLLKKYGFNAVFFITGKYIGQRCEFCSNNIDQNKKLMTPDQLRQLAVEGFMISNHFFSHRELANLSGDEKKKEYLDNQAILSEIVGQIDSLRFVAYPRNKKGEIGELTRDCGIKLGFGGEPALVDGDCDRHDLPRISVYNSDSLLKFRARLFPIYFLLQKLKR